MAMMDLGIGNTIVDVTTDVSPEATAFNQFYDTALSATLSDFDWPFARKRATLAGQAALTNDEWLYSYTYPTDCVAARRVAGIVRNDSSWNYVRFTLRLNATDSAVLLLTDQDQAILIYTMLNVTIGLWPANFVTALCYRLASMMAPSVTSTGGDPFQMSQRMMQFYNLHLHQAQSTSTNEERQDPLPESEFTTVQRFGY